MCVILPFFQAVSYLMFFCIYMNVRCLAFGLAPSPTSMIQPPNAAVNPSVSGSAPASFFCTECYYKPGICNGEGGNVTHHLGTPLPSSPPSANLIEGIHVTSPSAAPLLRSFSNEPISPQNMKYLNAEVNNKPLEKAEKSFNSPLDPTITKHHERLAPKDHIRTSVPFV